MSPSPWEGIQAASTNPERLIGAEQIIEMREAERPVASACSTIASQIHMGLQNSQLQTSLCWRPPGTQGQNSSLERGCVPTAQSPHQRQFLGAQCPADFFIRFFSDSYNSAFSSTKEQRGYATCCG